MPDIRVMQGVRLRPRESTPPFWDADRVADIQAEVREEARATARTWSPYMGWNNDLPKPTLGLCKWIHALFGKRG